MKHLYIVDFQYHDAHENKDIVDRWVLACGNLKELDEILNKNFQELERYGYTSIWHSFREISKTDNGFEVIIK